MREGAVVADRFEIERVVASGGMGSIWRARDRQSGAFVALKTLRDGFGSEARFREEARLATSIDHPAVVRALDHGRTAEGELYFAMEWLDGEDLSRALERRSLDVTETLSLAKCVASGLGAMHDRGAVHRDVKPANIFLVDGDPAKAKLIDLGIARSDQRTRQLTATHAVLGTVGYMAPEQAMGDRARIGPGTDVYSLGCVLFECLTGRAAFYGDNIVAVLAKALVEEVPLLRAVRPDLPAWLEDVVARMVTKSVEHRVRDGHAAYALLVSGAASQLGAPERPAISAVERRVTSVLLFDRGGTSVDAETMSSDDLEQERQSLERAAASADVKVHLLSGGSMLLVHDEVGTPLDRAVGTAAIALRLVSAFPSARVVVATGGASSETDAARGSPVDSAARLLRVAEGGWALADDATVTLVGPRFETAPAPHGARLIADRGAERDMLLGRVVPFVGRERELSQLYALFAESAGDGVARAALVVGEPGMGKTRLRRELVFRISTTFSNARVIVAHAEPTSESAPFFMLRQLLRGAAGITRESSREEAHALLRRHFGETRLDAEDARFGAVLFELLDLASDNAASEPLRSDPSVFAQWVERAVIAWLGGLARARPTLLVLEDLHWADAATLGQLREALRAHEESSLMVVAFSRPELGAGAAQLPVELRIELTPLPRKAAARLVSAALPDLAEPAVDAVVARAGGNAYLLEELTRAVARGDATEVPLGVLALVEHRLAALDEPDRRLLRAAAVFGERFDIEGVASLVAEDRDDVGRRCALLAKGEFLARADASAFGFRHALLRDAAYSMLPAEDRERAHGVAAAWLSRQAVSPIAVAYHFERSATPREACPWLEKAVRDAVEAFEVRLAIDLAARAIALTDDETARARICALRAGARVMVGDLAGALEDARFARDVLPVGRPDSSLALSYGLTAAIFNGAPEDIAQFAMASLSAVEIGEPTLPFARAGGLTFLALCQVSPPSMMRPILDRMVARADTTGSEALRAFALYSRCIFERTCLCEIAPSIATIEEAQERLSSLGDPGGYCAALLEEAFCWLEVSPRAALLAVERARKAARVLDRTFFEPWMHGTEAWALLFGSDPERGEVMMQERTTSRDAYNAAFGHGCLAELAAQRSNEALARQYLEKVDEFAAFNPLFRVIGVTVRARLDLAAGRLEAVVGAVSSISSEIDAGAVPVPFNLRSTLYCLLAQALSRQGQQGAAAAGVNAALSLHRRVYASFESRPDIQKDLRELAPHRDLFDVARALGVAPPGDAVATESVC